MHSIQLISNYSAVQTLELREAGTLRAHPQVRVLSTHSLEYYVEYTNLTSGMRMCAGLQHRWNVLKDGFPTPHNLRAWCRAHEQLSEGAGDMFLTVHACLRRCSTGEVVAEVEM